MMLLVKFLLAVLLLVTVSASNCQTPGRGRGTLIERWETENQAFKIRVTEYEEERRAVLSYYDYVFESMPIGTGEWSEVMTFVHPDSVPLPKDQVRFVGDNIAYVFMGWKYAVTIDGGRTWSVWDAGRELPNCTYCTYELIRDVQITPDGAGRMMLNTKLSAPGAVKELHTRDYGRHWTVE